ncbi:class I SAM-dependent methyltransferase [Tenacibaculum sp. MEBiC06402]|uniref:class I SAM-dependent methyltransferase n=1 Tax=unclassified Tenacibaculum TaxID=2635139 RepID=UPI003B9A1E86
MFFYSTEVTSSQISSDSPLFQRTKKAYELIKDKVYGNLLEIGPGEGYGLDILSQAQKDLKISAVDKSKYAIQRLKNKFPEANIIQQRVPPLSRIQSNSQDFVIAFQVIEHIKNDTHFLKEIHRVLKPSGTLFLTTPNANRSVSRNPWHYREYTFEELQKLSQSIFKESKVKGITGSEVAMEYYEENKKSVAQILKWDIFKLEKHAPRFILKLPYELLNRFNRTSLLKKHTGIISNINADSYFLTENCDENTLDFFCELKK